MKKTGIFFSHMMAFGLSMVLLAGAPQANALDLDIGIKIGDGVAEPAKSSPAKSGPPDHAPAHGYRAKHSYHYYPDAQVYFDTGRDVYFYLSDGAWKLSAALPGSLKVSLGSHISIDMDSDKPYTKHSEHKAKYPPGKMKQQQAKANGKKNNKHN
ncbi:MAG: hypothetical protein L0Z73_19270 [Gammaproteobacteria bacterium]|nr:hypothetical protein [Gammaproteobacteria bacterium]